MKKILKETLWLLIPIILGIGISYALGIQVFSNDGTFDINIHDTYFVIESLYVLFFVLALTIFIFYILREFKLGFRNAPALLILVISGIVSILLLTKLNGIAAFLGNTALDTFTTPSPENQIQQKIFVIWNVISNSILGIQFFIMMVLAFFTFKTAKNL